MLEIIGENVPQAYWEGLFKLTRGAATREDSRNGPVLTVKEPTVLKITHPDERVLFDPFRNANPFFHLMEAVWMLAGSNDAGWLARYNSRMLEYANDGVLRGAYGWRWRRNNVDQLVDIIHLLQRDPTTRQAVMSMWDPLYDNATVDTADRPCNTHIYFRVDNGFLNMTVCNRSNDFIWGMLGANAVHMTVLHEFVAMATGYALGRYYVMTNNLHIYPEMPNYEQIISTPGPYDHYTDKNPVGTMPILRDGEDWGDFLEDCERMLIDMEHGYKCEWFNAVALPAKRAYEVRKNHEGTGQGYVAKIQAPDWRLACDQWITRKEATRG